MTGSANQPDQETAARDTFERLAIAQLACKGVGRRRMFGRDGLTVQGRFYAFLDADRLLLKLPPPTAGTLLAAGQATTATSVSPAMTKWVGVSLAAQPESWQDLIDQARRHTAGEQGNATGWTVRSRSLSAPDAHRAD